MYVFFLMILNGLSRIHYWTWTSFQSESPDRQIRKRIVDGSLIISFILLIDDYKECMEYETRIVSKLAVARRWWRRRAMRVLRYPNYPQKYEMNKLDESLGTSGLFDSGSHEWAPRCPDVHWLDVFFVVVFLFFNDLHIICFVVGKRKQKRIKLHHKGSTEHIY